MEKQWHNGASTSLKELQKLEGFFDSINNTVFS